MRRDETVQRGMIRVLQLLLLSYRASQLRQGVIWLTNQVRLLTRSYFSALSRYRDLRNLPLTAASHRECFVSCSETAVIPVLCPSSQRRCQWDRDCPCKELEA